MIRTEIKHQTPLVLVLTSSFWMMEDVAGGVEGLAAVCHALLVRREEVLVWGFAELLRTSVHFAKSSQQSV